MSADLELHVRTENVSGGIRLRFEIHSATGKVPYTRHPIEGTTTIQAESLRAYAASRLDTFQNLDASSYVARNAPGGLERELSALGQELYRELFPELLQIEYGKFRDRITTLLIVSDEPWIPWELVKPHGEGFEDDFLCCRFKLIRWLSGKTTSASDFGADEIGVSRLAVIVAGEGGDDPTAGSAEAESESAFLQQLAGRHGGVETRILAAARYDQVDQLLTEGGCSVLHFVGHGIFRDRDPNASIFRLADGRDFRPRDLHRRIEIRLRKDRPLVFFNSCQVARQATVVTRLGGWVPRWILDCGCGAFVGPTWKIDTTQAAFFAIRFYAALEGEDTVATAARQARLELREAFPDGTGWLAYTVYAHPAARLRLGLGPTPLWIPEARWRPDVSPPGALLRAEYRVVPFHGRKDELASLTDWCGDASPVAVRLYTGAGGMGKTRLALEICRRLRVEGWEVGLYAQEADPAPPTAGGLEAMLVRGKPVLAVVDYAENRRDLLVPLARELYQLRQSPEPRSGRSKVRLILLARAALGWWEALQREGDGVGDLLSGPATRWWTLQPLADGPDERRASYREALAAFAARLAKPPPEGEPPDLGAEFYNRVLYIHTQALAVVEGTPLDERDDLLDYILRRERRFWERLATERGVPTSLVEGIGRAMAAFNLGGGAKNENHAVEVLSRLRLFVDQPRAVQIQVAHLLRDTYPGDRWIEPMLPDLLGEHHTRRELEKDAGELLSLVVPAAPKKE